MGIAGIQFAWLLVLFALPAAIALLWNPMPYRERLVWTAICLFTSWFGLGAFLFYALLRERMPRSG
jgi:hypothetical protein